jgi:hypothetical protein
VNTKVACLMGTYGRYTLACEALACFLQQTAIEEATLLIYNQHPIPLAFDHPHVRVVNDTPPHQGLRYIRKTMIDMIDPDVEFIHWWDDDDLYLPWHLEDCLEHIADAVAWRPAQSWYSERNTVFSKRHNRFEASWIMRADKLRAAPIDTHPGSSDHPFIFQTEDAGLLRTDDLGDFASYIYRWDTGTQHLSGYGAGSPDKQETNVESWRAKSADVRADGKVVVPDLWPRWQQFLDGIRGQVAPGSLDEIQARLSLAEAMSKLS